MNRCTVVICVIVSVMLHLALLFFLENNIPAAAGTGSNGARFFTATFHSLPSATAVHDKKEAVSPVPAASRTAQKTNRNNQREATALGGYFQQFNRQRSLLLARLEKNKVYPSAARRPGKEIEGSVSMRITLDKNGNLVSLETLKSSGSSILDWAANDLVRKVLPFRHNLGSPFTCEISIGYWLKD